MSKLEELDKKYGATTIRQRGLTIISMPVMCKGQIDIGFSRRQWKLRGQLLPFFARTEFGSGLYTYGGQAEKWAPLFSANSELCSALRTLLDGCVTNVEWTGTDVAVRINILYGSADGDASGGDRFYTSLLTVSSELGTIYEHGRASGVAQPAKIWGPAKFRKIMLATSFFGTFSFLMLVHYLTRWR
jgi:hypothetical protein